MISGQLRNKNILFLTSAHHSVVDTYVGDESIVELGWQQLGGGVARVWGIMKHKG